MTPHAFEIDPKRLGFILARYKFVAKMLSGKNYVLEVGCADGFGARVVRQEVSIMAAIDVDEKSIEEAKKAYANSAWKDICFMRADIRDRIFLPFDAVFALDVLEHIHPTDEQDFLEAMRGVAPVAIIGSPSLESQAYASALSKEGHVNCKTGPDFVATLRRHWSQVFLFGMNDEVLHTGYAPMAQYRFGLCVG